MSSRASPECSARKKLDGAGAGTGAAGALKPDVLTGGGIQHQFGDDAQAAGVDLVEEELKIAQGAAGGMDIVVIGNIVAIVATGRRAGPRWR
jgi:hypothetical protein